MSIAISLFEAAWADKMRICYDYQIFSIQRYGGVSRYFVELASRMHRYSRADVRVIAPLYKSNFLAARSSELPVLGRHYLDHFLGEAMVPRFDLICSRLFSMVYKPDIVHETYYSRWRTSSSSAKKVVTVYDTIEELFPEYFSTSKTTMELRKAVYARADHVICISENTREDLLRLYGLDPQHVSVVHLASSLVLSEQPPIVTEGPFFLYVGNRMLYKNFLRLLDAFAASRLYETHRLVCFGGGKFTADEIGRINQLKIPASQIFWVEGDDALLSRYYAGATAFIYPSVYEGFGIPLLEAMECNCPVICANNSSIPEVAGDAALYFDAGNTQDISNTMLRVAHSAEDRFHLVQKGKARVKKFSWDICAQQTYAIYERLLSKQ